MMEYFTDWKEAVLEAMAKKDHPDEAEDKKLIKEELEMIKESEVLSGGVKVTNDIGILNNNLICTTS